MFMIKVLKMKRGFTVMTNQEILSIFRPFVDFLGSALGENVEIVLHDFSDGRRIYGVRFRFT